MAIITVSYLLSKISLALTSVFKFTSTPKISSCLVYHFASAISSSLKSGAPPGIKLPPNLSPFSNNTALWPLTAKTLAASQPATPPPTIRTFFSLRIGS